MMDDGTGVDQAPFHPKGISIWCFYSHIKTVFVGGPEVCM